MDRHMPPICYPPGTHPDDVHAASPSSSGETHKEALMAFGGAFLAGVALNALAPHLPQGVSFRPDVHMAFRDGMPMTTAELSGNSEFSSFRPLRKLRAGVDETPRPNPMGMELGVLEERP